MDELLKVYHLQCGDSFVDLDLKSGNYFLNKTCAIPFISRHEAQRYADDHRGDGNNYIVIERSYDIKKLGKNVEVKQFVNIEGEGVQDSETKIIFNELKDDNHTIRAEKVTENERSSIFGEVD